MSLLDLPSLAAATDAPNIRFDFVEAESIGTKAGNSPSQDLYIEISGQLITGKSTTLRTIVTDPGGQAHLTGLGVLAAVERIFGWDGLPAASGGLRMPETFIPAETALARFRQFGVRIWSEEE